VGPVKLANGRLLIPVRAEDPETGAVGDGLVEIGPDHPEYSAWRADLDRVRPAPDVAALAMAQAVAAGDRDAADDIFSLATADAHPRGG
jgi:hypothetical protein